MSEEDDRHLASDYFQKAYAHQMNGELEQAIELYKKSIETFPTAEAHTFLGWTYSFQERYEEAIEECKLAIAVDPDFGNPYNDIGAYLIELGRLEEAIPWLEQATNAVRYESYCFPHYNLGRVYERLRQWKRAKECFQASLEYNPQYILAQTGLRRIQALSN
jgi:tetratricopeptide (TPR) repeat protein